MVRIIDAGPLWEFGGIPNSHRGYIKQIAKKHQVWLTEFPNLSFGDEFVDMFHSFKFNRYNHMMFLYGDTENWYKFEGHDCIGYNVYEGDCPPTSWVNNMNNPHIKEIWVPSKYVKEVYIKRGVKKPIKVVPHGISKNFKPLKIKNQFKVIGNRNNQFKYIGLPVTSKNGEDIFKDKFVFFGMGSIYGTGQRDRKGIDILLKSFEEAFKKDNDICLIIKLNIKFAMGYHKEKGLEFNLETYLRKFVQKNKNVYVLIQDLEEKQLVELYNSVDCGVFPSRAEGFGMSQQEMMACGNPVITTNYSSTNEFSQKNLRIKINGMKLAEFNNIDEQRVPYIGSRWAEPSIIHLTKLMKDMVKNYKRYKKSAEKHGKYIRREYDWNKIGREINKHIQKNYSYKNPTNVLCKNCLKKKKKIFMNMVQSEEDKKKLICPACHAWIERKKIN